MSKLLIDMLCANFQTVSDNHCSFKSSNISMLLIIGLELKVTVEGLHILPTVHNKVQDVTANECQKIVPSAETCLCSPAHACTRSNS